MKIFLDDLSATEALATRLANTAQSGLTIALSGELGAGKTTFVRLFAQALGIDDVRSPTFQIIREHRQGSLALVHADFYRLCDEEALEQLGFDDATKDAVCCVEWWERFPSALSDHLLLTLKYTPDGESRIATLSATDKRHARWMENAQ